MEKSIKQNGAATYEIKNGVQEIKVEDLNRVDEGAAILEGIPSLQGKHGILDLFQSFMHETGYLREAKFNSFLERFKLEVERLESIYSKEEIVAMLDEVRGAYRESPFANRVQEWPRGYQGDFETIDYILKGENKAKRGTLGYMVENYFLTSDICQQHRNKVERQAQLIKEVISKNPAAKIISIGCGTSEDVKSCIPEIENSRTQITLVDVDQAALDFSIQRLLSIKERITPIAGNIYKIMRSLPERYDLILIGGVFDYLNDKTIVSILSSLENNLTENGKIFFTNIDANNPYRVFMEYTANWSLIERSKNDIINLIEQAGWQEGPFLAYKDKTGLTHLVELQHQKDTISL